MSSTIQQPRAVQQVIDGHATSDGAGVRLTRLLPARNVTQLDPFLLLDAFDSDRPDDYIAGFPPHPHRGFETVTYLLAGRMRHRDSTGREGVIRAGGVQWMTAGSGIEHAEMPEQEDGLLAGFQLWINLPAAHKMDPPRYQEFEPEQIPEQSLANGGRVRVVAGTSSAAGSAGMRGAVTEVAVQPLYLDITLPAGGNYAETLPIGHNALVYVIGGDLRVDASSAQPDSNASATALHAGQLAILGDGDGVRLQAHSDSRALLIAARPIGEPVARHGPFVMNTDAEIAQAYRDYQAGDFGHVEDHDHAAT